MGALDKVKKVGPNQKEWQVQNVERHKRAKDNLGISNRNPKKENS